MAEDTETMPAPSNDEVVPETRYQVINTSRGRHNRSHRAALPSHRGMKQHLGAGEHRLVRGRPLILSEDQFQKHFEEIKAKADGHMLEVRTMDGRKVDLETMVAERGMPSPPLPHPPLDSVANDKNAGMGQVIPPYVGDDQSSMPNVLPKGQIPEILKKKAQEEQLEKEAEGSDTVEKAIEDLGQDDEDPSAPEGDEGVSSEKGDT